MNSRYYIELSDSPADRLYLRESQVDRLNYDYNTGYHVYAIAICADGGEVIHEFKFASKEARDDYAIENHIDIVNHEWISDIEDYIVYENGCHEELIPCRYDMEVGYARA